MSCLDWNLDRLENRLTVLRDRDLNRHRLLDGVGKLEDLGAGGSCGSSDGHLLPTCQSIKWQLSFLYNEWYCQL